MNCEKVEEHLSAFLDNALDPRHAQEIRVHVEECPRCHAILDDYRSFDHLLATAPRIEPPETLRAQIFDSATYGEIVRERAANGDLGDQSGEDWEIFGVSAVPELADDAQSDSPELEFPELADPAAGDVPAEGPPAFARDGTRLWSAGAKVLVPVAAVLTLTLGAALLFRQGFFPFGASTGQGTITTIGNPGQTGAPLSAGPRLVYVHDGILWSAPENGPGLAQPLTPTNITVGGWAVSPLAGASGARLVAYTDARSGAVHVIRSDSQGDHTLGVAAAGGLAWSPDGARIAYVARDGVLHLVNMDGTNDQAISGVNARASLATWSGDGQWLAYAETRGGVGSVWAYGFADGATHELAAQADADDLEASVTQLAWLPDAQRPSVTWATGVNGSFVGLYSRSVLGNGAAQRLTPAGAVYTVATYSPSRVGGAWLVASGTKLWLISAETGKLSAAGAAGVPITRIVWSPAGMAAVVAGDKLAIWLGATSLAQVDTGAKDLAPAWAADGQNLLYATGSGVQIIHITADGRAMAPAPVLPATDVAALGWAPDGLGVAIVTTAGVLLSSPDGAHVKLADHHGADGGQMVWSVAM